MSADNEVNLKRVLRVFRNAIVDHVRSRLRAAFGSNAEGQLATLYGKKEPGSSVTQWERMKINAERARATPEVSTVVSDDFELLGVSDFFNVFERFYPELVRSLTAGADPAVFNEGKKGLLRCLQQVKVYRDPNAHDVSEAIDADSLLLCVINCKKVCSELGLDETKSTLNDLHEEFAYTSAKKHAVLLGLAAEPEFHAVAQKALALAGSTVELGFCSDIYGSGRFASVLGDLQNVVLLVDGKRPSELGTEERECLDAALTACEVHAITPTVLLSSKLDEVSIENALSDAARRAYKRAERLPLVVSYLDVTARRLSTQLRPGVTRRRRATVPVAIPAARAVHDDKLAPLIFDLIRDPQLRTARIVAPFATDVNFGSLGLLSQAMIEAKKRGCRVCLITRPPASGDTDISAKQRLLKVLHEEQIELYVNPQLHAKVYLFEREADRKFWAVGSHNLTNFAHNGRSLETSMVGYRSQEFDEAQTSFERARRHVDTLNFSVWAGQSS